MKRPALFEGILVALIVSIVASAVFTIMSAFFPTSWILHALIAGTSFVYLMYLLFRSHEKVGKPTVVAVWTLVTIAAWMFSPSLLISLFVHISLIWLVRALYYYSSLFMALFDLGLILFAMAASIWTIYHTNSLFLATWCFFLLQSVFVFIPEDLREHLKVKRGAPEVSNPEKSNPANDGFEQAYLTAQTAIRQLSTK